MAEIVEIHPDNPQPRLVSQVAAAVRAQRLIAYPTDSSYAFGCEIGNKPCIERIRRIRRTDKTHNFTLVCKDLSEIATYARVENWAYRLLRSFTPGPYTFILKATGEVPKRLQHAKRRTIGIRVPDHPVTQALLDVLSEPIMSSTLLLPDSDLPLTNAHDIEQRIGDRIDLIVDAGASGFEPTSVVDLSSGSVVILRRGKGDVSVFE